MTRNEKYDADVAAVMRDHGDVLRGVINGQIAEQLASIVSSSPLQSAEREASYQSIKVLKDFLASLENSVLYDNRRRHNDRAATTTSATDL